MRVYPTEDTDTLNLQNIMFIDIADKFAEAVSKNISAGVGLKILYDGKKKEVIHYDETDGYYLHTELLCNLINQIFLFELEYQDRDDYLVPLLKIIKEGIDNDVEISKTVKELFKDLYVKGFFIDDISAIFFQDKLNLYLMKL